MSNGEFIRSPTRSVDDLVRAMGMEGISKSQVSRLCAEIPDAAKLLSPSGWREGDVTRLEAAARPLVRAVLTLKVGKASGTQVVCLDGAMPKTVGG